MRVPNPPPNHNPRIPAKTPRASSTLMLHNPQRLAVTVLEPEQFFSTGEQNCDFVFQIPAKPLDLYVELKGSNLLHTLDQLANTLRLLPPSTGVKECVIVVQRSPPSGDTTSQNRKIAFERRHKCKIITKTKHCDYHL